MFITAPFCVRPDDFGHGCPEAFSVYLFNFFNLFVQTLLVLPLILSVAGTLPVFLELEYYRRGFQAYKLPDLSTGYDFQHLETLL